MYKKITVQQLRLGMHIHALGGAWIHHPFWRSAFLLDAPEDLRLLRTSSVPEVWIDTSKGLDVHQDKVTAHDAPEQAEPPVLEVFTPHGTDATPLGLEIAHARALCAQARDAVMEMFSRWSRTPEITRKNSKKQCLCSGKNSIPQKLLRKQL